MSSKEQELTTKNDDDGKPDSSSQTMAAPAEVLPDDTPKDSGDSIKDKADDAKSINDTPLTDSGDSKQITDESSKPINLNKSSEFDDEDDFNSDEMQLRWDDDDDSMNDEKSNVKVINDSFSKDSETGNPSTSLVTAVKELDNALVETSNIDVELGSPNKDSSDTVGNKEAKGNSSKDILNDIDKLIGSDDVDKAGTTKNIDIHQVDSKGVPKVAEKSTGDIEMSVDSRASENSDSENKIDAVSASSSKDSITMDEVESKKPADTSKLNESTDSLEIINESSLLSSTVNESLQEVTTKVEHGLNKPDMMLEIPTQELIDCMDDFDSDSEKSDEKSKSFDVSKQISSLEKEMDDQCGDSADDSKLTGKDLVADENVIHQKDRSKVHTDSNIQDSKMIDQQKGEQSLGKSKIEEETTKNVKDSLNDVEMCDMSDKSVSVLPNTESDKKTEKETVKNVNTSVDISPLDVNTKNMSAEISLMDIDECKTPEKELSSALISEELPKDLEKEHTVAKANIELGKDKKIEKFDDNLQPSIGESSKQINEKVDKELSRQSHKVSVTTENKNIQEAASQVLGTSKDKDTKIAAVIENTESAATTSTVKLKLKVDTNLKEHDLLHSKEIKQNSELQEISTNTKPSESIKTSQESDLKPIVTPSLEPDPSKLDQKCTKQERVESKSEELSTSKEINETVKVVTTEHQLPKDALKSKNIETIKTDEATTSKDPSKEEPITPNLESINSEQALKDPVVDQPSTSAEPTSKDPSKEDPATRIIAPSTSESTDVLDQPSTSNSDKQMDQIPDTTDEVPEMEDTLGLLAESSRVVDADAEEGSSEGGEVEEDEEGDDDDFDPDDESSNQMTAEHSEESNAQPDKEDGQTDKEDKTPEPVKEFNFVIASVAGEENETEVNEDAKAVEAISAPTETTPASVAAPETGTQAADKETTAQDEQANDPESIQVTEISKQETEAATNSILKELLSKQEMLAKETKTSAGGVVDLESSSEDDETKKKTGLDATSGDKEKEATSSQKEKVTTIATSNAEVFNLDSDDDDVPRLANEITIEDKPESNKCINPACKSGARTTYVIADAAARAYFDADKKKNHKVCLTCAEAVVERTKVPCKSVCLSYVIADAVEVGTCSRAYFDADKKKNHKVCLTCAEAVVERTKGLVNGIKEFTPLLELDLRKVSTETVEISDSDSDDGETEPVHPDVLGESGAKFLEEHLADVINETWLKYKLDQRLGDAQSELDKELEKLEAESKEIDTMLNECQVATDLLRNQLYATFEPERRELTAICIMDTPMEKYSFCESVPIQTAPPDVRMKRKSTAPNEQPAKRAAIPLGYTPLETEAAKTAEPTNMDDDKDVSVVKLSAESAPSDLPPPGEIVHQTLRAGMSVYAMRNSFCTWVPGKIIEIQPKNPGNPFTMCRVRFEIRQKIATRVLAARCLAYLQPADVRLTIGTRVIALSQENAKSEDAAQRKTFYSGIVAEIPNPVNSYRYLIFFDHGYAQYVNHRDTRVVCESANLVWEEVHPNSREFVKQYLLAYPERPMVRLHAGQSLKTEWNGKWWVTKVLQVDASLVEVSFEDNRTEWIYRGSTRLAPLFLELQAAERQRSRPLPRSNQRRLNMPYVEYTRSEEQNKAEAAVAAEKAKQEQQNEEMRRQRAVAKKSTALPTPPPSQAPQSNLDSVTSRVVYYTPKNAVKPLKMTPHTCSPKCKRSDVLALKDLRTYNPLAKPLLSGWERQIVRFKGHKEVMYRAPCGRRLRNMRELHRYLRAIQSDMGVDLFDFGANTHCLAEFVLNKCLVGKKDLSHGKENVPVPCVNYYDESLPEFCSYNTERTPTAGVPLNLDPDFLCGCDCTDDCEDKTKCACWKMTLEGARTIGLQGCNVGYEYKRLPEPLPSGIYECNSRCKCKQTCLNRVAQHPLQLKLQVFKTMNRGWGIRALNDVPKGSFLCVYAGNLLTDATANLDGLNEGDEYLAELDYIEVVEQMKEGYEEDIPEADKKLDRESSKSASEEEEPSSEEEDNSNDKEDGDFQPGYIGLGLTEFNKRLRKRDRTRKRDANKEKGKEIDKGMEDDGCITISDDEEAKEPTQFTAQTGIGANEFVPKYKSVRTLFGKDEACYIMDAKVQGNIGRYLNHSCTPNVFVQNVFVDTHDPRFPWVAFFALSHIRAGTELTWNYNYDVGSVPGKVLYCFCGAPNCRRRLL